MRESVFVNCAATIIILLGWSGQGLADDVKIQPIRVGTSDGSRYANVPHLFEAETQKIWAQAGHTITFLPLKTIERDIYYTIDGDLDFAALLLDPFAGRSSGAYDMWIVDSIDGAWGRACLGGDGFAVSDNIFTASVVFYSDATLSTSQARATLARIASALAVQTNGFG